MMHARASLAGLASPWTTLDRLAAAVPPALRSWLTEPGLLTDRIRELCGERLRFRMLGPLRALSLSDELHARLGGYDERGLAREIEFRCLHERVVYAQTVLPDSTVRAHPWLRELGDSPIGESLRRAGGVLAREPLEYAPLPPEHVLALAASEGSPDARGVTLWARRAVYRLDGLGILVQEVFLPALLRVEAGRNGAPDTPTEEP
jgi:chorismate--pyruvate lyase